MTSKRYHWGVGHQKKKRKERKEKEKKEKREKKEKKEKKKRRKNVCCGTCKRAKQKTMFQ